MYRMRYFAALVILSVFIFALNSATSIQFVGAEPYELTYPANFGSRYRIPEDNPITVEGVALGRMLFYETALSAGNKISCGSCHRQELAFTDGKAFSVGVDGVKQSRNTMALVNLLWIKNFFWDGRTEGLESQLIEPLTNVHEMGQPLQISVKKLEEKGIYSERFGQAFGDPKITEDRIRKALAQFERTLISGNSRYDQYLRGAYKPTSSELSGISLFYGQGTMGGQIRSAGCSHCHGGPQTYSELFMNNGLDSIYRDLGRANVTGLDYDQGRFRMVTLRNIALTAPYMHDGRFKSLEEVIAHYSDHVLKIKNLSPFLDNISNKVRGGQLRLTKAEKADLLAFLHMLTDSTFITDSRFSDPFVTRKN